VAATYAGRLQAARHRDRDWRAEGIGLLLQPAGFAVGLATVSLWLASRTSCRLSMLRTTTLRHAHGSAPTACDT